MSPLYCFQFFLFSTCIHLFTVFTYLVYYSDLFSSVFREELMLEYDYIIVGSGTAGSLIAHRLAKETNFSIIVLEAGTKGNSLLDIPVVGPLLHGSLYDWQFESVPQEHGCFAMKDRKCKLTQGRIVGGSSKMNNMVHFRGNISHYAQWFHGKYTEGYIRKQFEYIENNIVYLDEMQYESCLTTAMLSAAAELGYHELGTEFQRGFMKSRLSQRDGKRWSTSDHLDLSKLVLTNALVEKLIIEDDIAKGIVFQHLGQRKTIYVRKGVILSAGAYNTPKILQLSGIGPLKLLKSLKIPVLKNLPVGENLQDHVTTGLDLVLFNKSLSIGANDILNPIHMYQYFIHGKGPLTSPGCEVVGVLSTRNEATPELQFMVLPVGISSDRGSHLRKSVGVKDDVWENYFVKAFDKYTASILPIILHPKSKGTVFIYSKDPMKPPLIDPKYLSNEDDRKTLIKGLKFVLKFVHTKSMKSIGAYINPTPFPGCENHTMFTDAYWKCYIRHLTLPSYHPVGTCSMGLPESKNSVIDTSFRLIGLKSLYIVDASVLPTLPSGNINAAISMMANLFFETNIKPILKQNYKHKFSNMVCFRKNMFNDFLFKTCSMSL